MANLPKINKKQIILNDCTYCKNKLEYSIGNNRFMHRCGKEGKDLIEVGITWNIYIPDWCPLDDIEPDKPNEDIEISPIRNLAYRLLEISYISRVKILLELGLIDKENDKIEHVKLLDKIFNKAESEKKLSILWDKVNEKHNNTYNTNPFKPIE